MIAMVAATACVPPAQAAWSGEYVVAWGAVGNATGLGVWAGPDGRVAVTWTLAGQGPPSIWVREYVPTDGWHNAEKIRESTNVVPRVWAGAFGKGGTLWLAFDGPDGLATLQGGSYLPGEGLETVTVLGLPGAEAAEEAQMASNAAGRVAVAWRADGRLFQADLWETGWGNTNSLAKGNGTVTGFSWAMDEWGRQWAVWTAVGPEGSAVWQRIGDLEGTWFGGPYLVSSAGGSATETAVAIATNESTNPAVTWVEHSNGTAGMRLMTNPPTGRSAGSEPQEIASAREIQGLRSAWAAGGSAVVVWAQSEGGGFITCWSKRGASGNWSAPAALHEGAGASFDAQAQAGTKGSVWATWTANGPQGPAIWARQFEGSWRPGELVVEGTNFDSSSARLAVDGRGAAWVGWREGSESGWQLVVRASGLPQGENVARVAETAPEGGGLGAFVVPAATAVAAVVAVAWVTRRER